MKTAVVMAALALGMAGEAMAVDCPCTGNGTQLLDVQTLVKDKMACARISANQTWQEHHNPNGELWDYKRGSDKSDPSSKVGTWVAGNATRSAPQTVTYNYGPGQVYSYAVCTGSGAAGTYLFCNIATKTTIPGVTLSSVKGLASCGF
jgi:hypothetical protein